MIIDKNIQKFIVFAEDSVLEALRRISDNARRIVFSVTEAGRLEGVLSDGDLRRWLANQTHIDLNVPTSAVSNKDFVFAYAGDDREAIGRLFDQRIEYVPVLDRQHHLVAVAYRSSGTVQIGSFTVGNGHPVLTIAEIGNNHNGSLNLCRRLIDEAVAAGADCVKFQMRHMTSLYQNAGNPDDAGEDLGSQYTLDLLSRFNLGRDDLFKAFDHCRDLGVMPLCTPWDLESVAALEEYGMEGYKVASADLTNTDLLQALARTGKPLLQSTGMANEAEIREAVKLLQKLGAPFVLLHCNSTYPAPFRDLNLRYIARLQKIGDCPIGYSGHERGYHAVLAAVALGVRIVEKHFTLDRAMEGNDHKVSLLPNEFRAMVTAIREVEESLGSDAARAMSQGELMNREILAKSLTASRPIAKGETIVAGMLSVKSPGRGLQPNARPQLLGRKARRAMAAGDFFFPSDLEDGGIEPRAYRFRRSWGIPVRFHDCRQMLERVAPDLLEYHLSYKDLEVRLGDHFDRAFDLDLVVHAPELFANDHVLDLCAPDEAYRRRSVGELQRVVDMTRNLIPFHRRARRPLIIVNAGGFTFDGSLPVSRRRALYAQVGASLSELDTEGVEIIPQTMPPFPWHFGGQRYHNLFVDPDEIAAFCADYGMRVCLDVSHSKLACNHFKWSFKTFLDRVAPVSAHLHLVDARGVDGEGLQIGEGDIDFADLAEQLGRLAPDAGFIPEIWQGHKNGGEGFWIALDRLEAWF